MERPLLLLVDPEAVLQVPEQSSWHCAAWEQAVLDVCGLQVKWPDDRAGQTDYTLLRSVFEALAASEWLDADLFDRLAQAALLVWQETLPSTIESAVRPRVIACLTRLDTEPLVATVPCSGLQSGLLRLLLERAGLGQHMALGFSTGSQWQTTRPDIFDQARVRAGGNGLAWPCERTVFLAQCPEDIIAARSVNIPTIGFEQGALAADYALPDWDCLPELLSRLISSS